MTMSNDAKREKLVEKVRKLLEVTTENGATEAEATTAAERAHAILAEYNLSLGEVKAGAKKAFVVDDSTETAESLPWRRGIAGAVAELYFCAYFYVPVTKKGPKSSWKIDQHCFVGAPHNVEVAKLMFGYLHTTVHKLANAGAAKEPAGQQWSYRTSFKNAAADRLCQRIDRRIADAKKGTAKNESGTTLPALADLYTQTKNALDKFLADHLEDGLEDDKGKAKGTNKKGVREGAEAGEKISLDTQVTSSKKGKQIAAAA